MNYQGMTALVTGASGGMGEAFASQLAGNGCKLILSARSEQKLNALAERLRQQYRVEVTAIAAELSSQEPVQRLIAEIRHRGIQVDLLVNNAGLGLFENFLDTPLERQMEQVDVNVRALVTLTHAFAPGMVAARRGGIINIASTAGFQPLAGADIYAASKSFVILFSEGLALELEKSSVRVLAVCPGPVATQFFADKNPTLRINQMDQPVEIVRQVLRAFENRKHVVIPGKISNSLVTFSERFIPRKLVARIGAGVVQQLNHR